MAMGKALENKLQGMSGGRETSELHGNISDIRCQIVNELVKKELLRLNVDYVLFKEHKVQIFYPILGYHPHTF